MNFGYLIVGGKGVKRRRSYNPLTQVLGVDFLESVGGVGLAQIRFECFDECGFLFSTDAEALTRIPLGIFFIVLEDDAEVEVLPPLELTVERDNLVPWIHSEDDNVVLRAEVSYEFEAFLILCGGLGLGLIVAHVYDTCLL